MGSFVKGVDTTATCKSSCAAFGREAYTGAFAKTQTECEGIDKAKIDAEVSSLREEIKQFTGVKTIPASIQELEKRIIIQKIDHEEQEPTFDDYEEETQLM